MQSVRVAAAPVSQSDCSACLRKFEGPLAPQVCAACGTPQALLAGEDYFKTLGVRRQFKVDLSALEKRFYELSRALHPDRFLAQGAIESRKHSLIRMSWINDAYRTLKSPDLLRKYLLELEGISLPPSKPGNLAIQWFEVQDSMLEDPSNGPRLLESFENELRASLEGEGNQLSQLESDYDRKPSVEILHKIAERIQTLGYLQSLARDVERVKK